MDSENPKARWDITIGGAAVFFGLLYLIHPYDFADRVWYAGAGIFYIGAAGFLYLASEAAIIVILIILIVSCRWIYRRLKPKGKSVKSIMENPEFHKNALTFLQKTGQIPKDTERDADRN